MPAQRLLANLAPGSISVLITDPPHTSVERRAGGGYLNRWFRGGLSWPEIGRLLVTARRRLRPDGVAFVMTNGAGLKDALTAMDRAGFVRVQTLTWDRRSPGLGGGLRHQTEFILVGRLPGSRTLRGVDLLAVPAVGPATRGRYPTEKPEGLGRKIAAIAGIGRGDVVLDPFCGSGALLVGARERGAAVTGGDISAAAIARARSKLGVAPTRPARPANRPALRSVRRRPGSRHG
jgi:site-specific DNA-methyltransferase (adenine-specific)